MNFDYFFKGKMSREEAASAFLAMALNGCPDFRSGFLRLANVPGPELADEWDVHVEVERVDVTLISKRRIVLVENKLTGAACQDGQLLGYYREALGTAGKRPITAVLLAPTLETGKNELARVRASPEFQARVLLDTVEAVSWEDVCELRHPEYSWVTAGLGSIAEAIKAAQLTIYPAFGDRKALRDLVTAAATSLQPASCMRWHAKNREIIRLIGRNVTIDGFVEFSCLDDGRHDVVGARSQDGSWNVRLCVKAKPRTDLPARSALKIWWKEKCQAGELVLPTGTSLRADAKGWLIATRDFTGTDAALAAALIDLMTSTRDGLESTASVAGLTLTPAAPS